jgi:hypothetical protein
VMMRRDAGHPVCLDYISTGRGDGKAAVLPGEIGLAAGFGPFGIVTNTAPYTGGKKLMPSMTQELQNEESAAELSDLFEERLKKFLPAETPFEDAEKTVILAKDTSKKLVESLKELKKMTGGQLTPWHVVAAALQSGASQQGMYENMFFLDTHSSHEKVHLTNQKKAWSEVADIFALFKKLPYLKSSLFDYTTFMVVSEFSRTPNLNGGKGKDHNPFTNSVLLAGKNIKGGNAVGESRVIPKKVSKTGMAMHYARPFNYKEGKPTDTIAGASFLYPENVVQTVGAAFGNLQGFTPVDSKTPVIPGVVKA